LTYTADVYVTNGTGGRKDATRLTTFHGEMARLAGDHNIHRRLQQLDVSILAMRDGRITAKECPALSVEILLHHADTLLDRVRAVDDGKRTEWVSGARASYEQACAIIGRDILPRVRERIEREEQFLAAAATATNAA